MIFTQLLFYNNYLICWIFYAIAQGARNTASGFHKEWDVVSYEGSRLHNIIHVATLGSIIER